MNYLDQPAQPTTMKTPSTAHVLLKWFLIGLILCASRIAVAAEAAEATKPACLSECTPRIGIVSAFGAEADILLAQTEDKHEWLINGNRFTTGTLRGNPVVIVLSGVSMINATMNTQLLLDHFHIERLILSGIAGGINPATYVGDVIVPDRWAMPMEVYWNGNNSVPAACGKAGDIECLGLKLARDAQGRPLPAWRAKKQASGMFPRQNFVMNADNSPKGEFKLDYPVDEQMLAVARELRPVLDRCGPRNPKLCVNGTPLIRVGGRGLSGTAFLANPSYRAYLYSTLQGQAFDMETAALAHVAYANKIPYIAFRSLSDLAGGNDFKDVGAFFGSGLAESNEAKVTLAFLDAWKKQAQQ